MAMAPQSSPTMVEPHAGSKTKLKSGWSVSTYQSRYQWLTTPSGAGRTHCSAIPTPTAPKACTSLLAARLSLHDGLIHHTVASTSASHKTSKDCHDCYAYF